MDWNRVEGNWKQVKGKIKEKWGKLTDDDLNVIDGKRDQLEGKIQERYGTRRTRRRRISTTGTPPRGGNRIGANDPGKPGLVPGFFLLWKLASGSSPKPPKTLAQMERLRRSEHGS